MDPQSPSPNLPPIDKNHPILAAAVILAIVFILGIIAYLAYQNFQLKQQLAQNTPSPSPLVTPTPTPKETPQITFPSPGSTVKSPLKVKGTVPAGWMFEGVLPIKLLDEDRKLIATGQGKETTPGSWQSGNPAAFEGKIIFKTIEKSGFLVIEKNNPSGLPENADSFEIPVKF